MPSEIPGGQRPSISAGPRPTFQAAAAFIIRVRRPLAFFAKGNRSPDGQIELRPGAAGPSVTTLRDQPTPAADQPPARYTRRKTTALSAEYSSRWSNSAATGQHGRRVGRFDLLCQGKTIVCARVYLHGGMVRTAADFSRRLESVLQSSPTRSKHDDEECRQGGTQEMWGRSENRQIE